MSRVHFEQVLVGQKNRQIYCRLVSKGGNFPKGWDFPPLCMKLLSIYIGGVGTSPSVDCSPSKTMVSIVFSQNKNSELAIAHSMALTWKIQSPEHSELVRLLGTSQKQ